MRQGSCDETDRFRNFRMKASIPAVASNSRPEPNIVDKSASTTHERRLRHCIAAVILVFVFSVGLSMRAAEITVFAAASLRDSLQSISEAYEKQSGDKVVFSFAASSLLARQIEEGAPADIFFSADEASMDRLDTKSLILKETRVSRLSNSLVIVVAAKGSVQIQQPKDLASESVKRVALAEPRTVPAGIYAREYLLQQKLWPAVKSKVVPTQNVRAALAAVEAGNVEAGMVYKTDAAISKKVRVACRIPIEDGPRISYPMAMMRNCPHPEVAKRFLQYLNSAEAGIVFEQFGFVVSE